MKQLLIIILSLVIFTSCKRNNPTPNSSAKNTASANINGNSWGINSVRAFSPTDNDSLIFFTLEVIKYTPNYEPYIYEALSIKLFKTQDTQIFNLTDFPSISFSTAIEQGDVLGDNYKIIEESENNWVQITEQSDNYKTFKGKLNATLVKNHAGADPSRYPDTIHITHAEFNISID